MITLLHIDQACHNFLVSTDPHILHVYSVLEKVVTQHEAFLTQHELIEDFKTIIMVRLKGLTLGSPVPLDFATLQTVKTFEMAQNYATQLDGAT